jgi:hypothetical protein
MNRIRWKEEIAKMLDEIRDEYCLSDHESRLVYSDRILSLLAPVIEKAEKYKKALEQIERGCSFPEDDVQRAIRDVARKTLFEVPDGN